MFYTKSAVKWWCGSLYKDGAYKAIILFWYVDMGVRKGLQEGGTCPLLEDCHPFEKWPSMLFKVAAYIIHESFQIWVYHALPGFFSTGAHVCWVWVCFEVIFECFDRNSINCIFFSKYWSNNCMWLITINGIPLKTQL